MLSWIRTRVYRPAQSQHISTALEKPKLSRQELTDLFAKELGRPMLSKQSLRVREKANRPRAGRLFQFFRSRQFGLQTQQRRG